MTTPSAPRAQVEPLLDAAALAVADGREPTAERATLAALSTAADFVLLAALDGDAQAEPDSHEARRADEAARALAAGWTEPLTPGLLELARTGGPRGRQRAVTLLGRAPDPAAVLPTLEATFAGEQGELQLAALGALAQLGGASADQALRTALASQHLPLARRALDELAARPSPALTADVAALLADAERARRLWRPLVRYYATVPGALGAGELTRLIGLADRGGLATDAAVELLDTLARLPVAPDRAVGEKLERLIANAPPEVAEAAQIALARWGDKTVRRKLLERYDDLVARGREDPMPLVTRGRIHLRLGDGGPAAKDFKRALDLADQHNHPMGRREVCIDLARAYMLDTKLGPASDALERASLNALWRQRLVDDPLFAPLLAHPRFSKVLRGE